MRHADSSKKVPRSYFTSALESKYPKSCSSDHLRAAGYLQHTGKEVWLYDLSDLVTLCS